MLARLALCFGLSVPLSAALIGAAFSAALVRGLPEGGAYVRLDNAPGVIVPASCVRQLDSGLAAQGDPGSVEAVVGQATCSCAAGDPPMAAAVAAYAFTIVEESLAPAVLEGAKACAGDDTSVTPGPLPALKGGGALGLGGFGSVIREPCRNASPTTFC